MINRVINYLAEKYPQDDDFLRMVDDVVLNWVSPGEWEEDDDCADEYEYYSAHNNKEAEDVVVYNLLIEAKQALNLDYEFTTEDVEILIEFLEDVTGHRWKTY
jgi:hypothetical protein